MTSIGQKDTKKQVRAVESPLVPSLSLPRYVDLGSAFLHPHHSYHSLGHCLRTNIFPGLYISAPLTWKSLSRDSYISHPPAAGPTDPHLWYGHKTDEMVQWTERNILNQKLDKTLAEMKKKSNAK
ncbi:testis-expressed protein 33 isoform X1 [Sebastes umbrosus]|uniref:testis-expressed protein 33 isoform X1 n=1 Tax=Sebastes umbrosus TaxID=72105 RepID=UPI00189E9BEE|nr:testis-expressed protein 33 isoform X1 [Sebastes umbrosus]